MEHISLMAQEQVIIEFPQEMAMLTTDATSSCLCKIHKHTTTDCKKYLREIEARKAVLIADMTEEFMKEEKQITSQFDHDPLLEIKTKRSRS